MAKLFKDSREETQNEDHKDEDHKRSIQKDQSEKFYSVCLVGQRSFYISRTIILAFYLLLFTLWLCEWLITVPKEFPSHNTFNTNLINSCLDRQGGFRNTWLAIYNGICVSHPVIPPLNADDQSYFMPRLRGMMITNTQPRSINISTFSHFSLQRPRDPDKME